MSDNDLPLQSIPGRSVAWWCARVSVERGPSPGWPLRVGLALSTILALVASASADRPRARQLTEEGQRLLSDGETARALDHFEGAIEQDPDYLRAYELAMPLWAELELLGRARVRLERATLRQPGWTAGWYALGLVYRRQGHYQLATQAYRRVVELNPGDPDPYYGLAMSLLQVGDREAAAGALGKYLAREDRPERAPFVQWARGELARLGGVAPVPPARRSGRVASAVRAGLLAVVNSPLSGRAWRALGVALVGR